MKIILDGKEVEFLEELEEGEKELDLFKPEKENTIDLEDTIEFTKEDLEKIGEENE